MHQPESIWRTEHPEVKLSDSVYNMLNIQSCKKKRLLTPGCKTDDGVRSVHWWAVHSCSHGAQISRPEGAVQLHHVQRVSAVAIHWEVSECQTGLHACVISVPLGGENKSRHAKEDRAENCQDSSLHFDENAQHLLDNTERSADLFPFSSCPQAQMMLCADGAPYSQAPL